MIKIVGYFCLFTCLIAIVECQRSSEIFFKPQERDDLNGKGLAVNRTAMTIKRFKSSKYFQIHILYVH